MARRGEARVQGIDLVWSRPVGGGRSRAKVPKSENRTTDHAAPPGAEPPEGLRRRPAEAAVSGPPLTVVAGGAGKA